MKSVSSGPVTNHFSPLRTYSPVARVADGGGAQGPGIGAGAVLGDRVAPRALAAQRRLEVAPALLGVARGSGRCRRPGCTTTARRSTGRAARGRGPARRPTSPARRPRPGTSRRAAGPRSPPRRIGSPQSRGDPPAGAFELEPRAAGGRRGRTRGRAPGARAGRASGSGPSRPRMRHRARTLVRRVAGRGTAYRTGLAGGTNVPPRVDRWSPVGCDMRAI